MLSISRLGKLAEASDFDRLITEVARNGRALSLPVRLRLSEPHTLPVAALSLALQRINELTYRPTETATDLLIRLLSLRDPGGHFGSVVANALAASALHSVIDQLDAMPLRRAAAAAGRPAPDMPLVIDPELERETRAAAAAALHALNLAQESADDPSGLIGDQLESAIVLWQLGFDPRFARAVRFEALLGALESTGARHDRAVAPLVGPAFDTELPDSPESRDSGPSTRPVAA